jgi:hypothetical protein
MGKVIIVDLGFGFGFGFQESEGELADLPSSFSLVLILI